MARSRSSGAREVLVVSLRFPPHGGGGVQRVTYFVRHLAKLGWEPTVLTGPSDSGRELEDYSLLSVVPPEVRIIRTPFIESKLIFRGLRRLNLDRAFRMVTPTFPQMDAGWIPFAVRAGKKALEETGATVLLSSAYPMSSHVVALLLKQETGCPWVADYRDEWSLRSVLRWPTPAHRRAAGYLDRLIVDRADRVVTTSPAHTRRFVQELAHGDASKFATITNGFDPADFAGTPTPEPDKSGQDRFTIAHVGSLFSWRDGNTLFEAVREIVEEGTARPEEIRIRVVGNASCSIEDKGPLSSVIETTGYVDHASAVREMRSADLLALVNTEETNIPGKTFEYLASGRPILALVRPGPTADVVREARAGVVVDVIDKEGAKRALREAIARWRAGEPAPAPDPVVVARYSRGVTAARLSDLLSTVAAGHPDVETGNRP